jgi:hypothetical protein
MAKIIVWKRQANLQIIEIETYRNYLAAAFGDC